MPEILLIVLIGVVCIIIGMAIAANVIAKEDADGGYSKIIKYSEYVYYIPFRGDKFAKNLCMFMDLNRHLEVCALSGSCSDGHDKGYYVVFKNKDLQ